MCEQDNKMNNPYAGFIEKCEISNYKTLEGVWMMLKLAIFLKVTEP